MRSASAHACHARGAMRAAHAPAPCIPKQAEARHLLMCACMACCHHAHVSCRAAALVEAAAAAATAAPRWGRPWQRQRMGPSPHHTHWLAGLLPCHSTPCPPCSHGSTEFYERRIDLTKALIKERGFGAVVVEMDL